MLKAFTDKNKWTDPWVLELEAHQKFLYLFICDVCEPDGVWEISFKLMSFYTGLDLKECEKVFNSMKPFEDRFAYSGKFMLLRKHIIFQQGLPLDYRNFYHRKIIRLIESKHGKIFPELMEIATSAINLGVKNKNEYPRNQKPKAETQVVIIKPESKPKMTFMEFVFLSGEERDKLVERYGEKNLLMLIERLNNYIGSKGRKYKSHYHTILSWAQKDGIYKPPENKKEEKHVEASPEEMAKVHALVKETASKIR